MQTASLVSALVLLAATPAAGAAQSDDFTAPREGTASASGASRVEVEARAGSLRIEGREGLGEVRVRGTARASDRETLEDIKLVVEREGSTVVVRVEIPDGPGVRFGRWNAALDLVVEVPSTMALDVRDSSGDAVIRGVASLDLQDSSGDLELENIGGTVRVEDSSGGIYVRDVRGDVRVSDSSGEIEVSRVTGTVTVDHDSSGGIDVSGVGGDFVVRRDGSGGISYRDVKGSVDIPRRDRRGRRSNQ